MRLFASSTACPLQKHQLAPVSQCTGSCGPGQCLKEAAAEASDSTIELLLGLWFVLVLYIGAGVAWGRHRRVRSRVTKAPAAATAAGGLGARLMGDHPHFTLWLELGGLVIDGVHFSLSMLGVRLPGSTKRAEGREGLLRVRMAAAGRYCTLT